MSNKLNKLFYMAKLGHINKLYWLCKLIIVSFSSECSINTITKELFILGITRLKVAYKIAWKLCAHDKR